MQKYHETVISSIGRPVIGAAVRVTTLAGAAATIYSDNGVTPIASLVTDSTGAFGFYAADGRYTITISGSGFPTRVISDILLEDPSGSTSVLAASGGSALVGFYQAGTGAVARTVQVKLREVVSVKDFGAVGDGATNDTAAIQAAINYVKGFSEGRALFIPDGTYLVTAPLNCTASTLKYGLRIVGASQRTTRVYANLLSAGPVFDFTGIARAQMADLMIQVPSSSLATTAILTAAVDAGSVNYLPLFERLSIDTNDVAPASFVAGMVIHNSDLATLRNVEIYANRSGGSVVALWCGTSLPAGFSSPFQTISTVPNQTNYRIEDSWLVGNQSVEFTGGLGMTFANTYCAAQQSNSANNAIIRYNHPTQTYPSLLRGLNLRTENQVVGLTSLRNFVSTSGTQIREIQLTGGELNMGPPETSGAGVLSGAFFEFGTDIGALSLRSFTTSDAPLLNTTHNVQVVEGFFNVGRLGTVPANGIVRWDLSALFDSLEATLKPSLLAAVQKRGRINNYDMLGQNIYAKGSSQLITSAAGFDKLALRTTTAYTGGSGSAVKDSYLVPAGLVVGADGIGRSLKLEFGSTATATTTIAVRLRQGATTLVIGTSSSIAAGGVSGTVILDNRTTANGIFASAFLVGGTTVALNAFTAAAFGVIDVTADFYIDFLVNSATNDPWTIGAQSFLLS